MIITGLKPQDEGSVLFITPGGILFDEMGFNGENREFQKKYFKPGLIKSKNLCEKEQLVGTWTVMFRDYEMSKLYFEMLPDILPNQESHFVGCEIAYVLDPTTEGSSKPSEVIP